MACFNQFTNAYYVPIIQVVQEAFKMPSPFASSMNDLVWRIQSIPMNFVSIWLFNHFSYTSVLTVSACLQLIGGWLRQYAFLNNSFWPVLAGTSILSLSSELIWQSQNFLINKWFPVNEYAFATGLMMASNFAKLVGFAITGIVFANHSRDTISNLEVLIWRSNLFVTACFVFYMTYFRSEPDKPPSKVAQDKPPT